MPFAKKNRFNKEVDLSDPYSKNRESSLRYTLRMPDG